ncbi:MAG: hypothetical protein K2Q18_03165 [Bdellovibrionales bacterium]|nr:hypothetical protein [Bdellovibrionales bacterium]
MKSFLKLLFFMTVSIYAFSCFAYSESICWENDCNTFGWTTTSSTSERDFQCIRENCNTNGWVTGSFSLGSYFSCKNADCQKIGFYEIERSSQRLISQTVCENFDCTKYGSTTYSNQGVILLTCKEENCLHKGWQEVMNGKLISDTICLSDDCTKFGWKDFK